MDYAKALFALHVRKMAGQRVGMSMPTGLGEEEKQRFMSENFELAVEGVLNEIDWTMRIIDKQGE